MDDRPDTDCKRIHGERLGSDVHVSFQLRFSYHRGLGIPGDEQHLQARAAYDKVIGDIDAIIAYLIPRHALRIDAGLTSGQRDTDLLVRRMLDDLYWVMSYSRWKDDRFFPLFRDAILRTHRDVTAEALVQAREHNFKRYHFQGIGRYEPEAAYARGVADLQVLGRLVPAAGLVFGPQPSSIDAAIYGFIANIQFYEINTPLRDCVQSQQNLVRHREAVHAAVQG